MSEQPPRARRRRRRRRRLVGTILLLLVAVPLLALLGSLLALRSPGTRQAILTRLSALLAGEGLAFSAADFAPRWRHAAIELREVEIGAPGGPPLATAERLLLAVDLGSLRRRPLVVRRLEADGVRVDLTAPMPERRSRQHAALPPAVEIHRLRVRRGELRGAPPSGAGSRWLRGWSARGIAAEGSLRGGRIEGRLQRAEVWLERPGFGRQRLLVAGRARYDETARALSVAALRVDGDGLQLVASGEHGWTAGAGSSLLVELRAESHALAAGLPRGGSLALAGRLALPAGAGRLQLSAGDLPAAALAPYLDRELFGRLQLAGSTLDLQAQAAFGPAAVAGDFARLSGTARAVWRRQARPLARLDVRFAPGSATLPLAATIDAALLPTSPGRRHLTATLRAAGWTALSSTSAEAARLELALPDLAAALREGRALWPELVPAPPLPLPGPLTAEARLAGPLAAPAGRWNARWRPAVGSTLELAAAGRPLGGSSTTTLRATALPLALLDPLAPRLAGTLDGAATLSGAPGSWRLQLDATVAAPALPPHLERAERAVLAAEGVLSSDPLAFRGSFTASGDGAEGRLDGADVRLGDTRLTGEGLLALAPLRWSGRATLAGAVAERVGSGRLDHFEVTADGSLSTSPLSFAGALAAGAATVEAPPSARLERVTVRADGALGTDLRALAARTRLTAGTLTLAATGEAVRDLVVDVEAGAGELRLSGFTGALPDGGAFTGAGRSDLAPLLASAELQLQLRRPLAAVASAALTATLRDGLLEARMPRIETAAGPVALHARLPLAALGELPALSGVNAALPGPRASGAIELELEAAHLDSAPLLAALGMEPRRERLRTGVSAELTLDLAAPEASRGELRLGGLRVETPEGTLDTGGPTTLRLGGGRVDLLPLLLRFHDLDGTQRGAVELAASGVLAAGWHPLADPPPSPTGALATLDASAQGTVDTALLNPYLAGGVATGTLRFTGRAAGAPDRLAGELTATGPEVSLLWPRSALRIDQPRLALAMDEGQLTVRAGEAQLNGGGLRLTGWRSAAGELALAAALTGVRYRIEYGIDLQLSGRLDYTAPPEGRSQLTGQLTVERGVLDRDLDLDREVLALLLAPDEAVGTEGSPLAAIDLDLIIETADGVRIKNNLGDLRAGWRTLELGGTLETPILRGLIELEPGGLLYAYGQTVRVDRGALRFTGDPLTDPEVELVTTSSLQDPRIAQLRGRSPLDLLLQQDEDETPTDRETMLEAGRRGLAGYYGARFVRRLGESAGLGGLTVRPVLIYEKADPTARLTVGKDLSRHVSFALSVDLRNAERQTYLVGAGEVPGLPGLRLEGYTDDRGERGASLQQSIELGGARGPRAGAGGAGAGELGSPEPGPLLRRVEVTAPRRTVSPRRLRGVIRLPRRQPLPAGAAFAVEVDVADLLRRRGYPDPRLSVALRPVAGRPGWADVVVAVAPGPRVRFRWAGDRPPRALRPSIAALYRTDFYEPLARVEMRQAVVRALRATGHLDPQVTIEVERERPEDPDGPRLVTVRADGGRQVPLRTLEVAGPGLDEESARLVAAALPSTLARAELASGLPQAERVLLAALAGLGYPDARLVDRQLLEGGARLQARIEPGARRTVAAVELRGVPEEEGRRLTARVPLAAGDPARLDQITAGGRRIEEDLRQRGHSRASVRSSQRPLADDPSRVLVLYEVSPGPAHHLATVTVSGTRWSRPAPLLRQLDLQPGAPYRDATLEQARGRLFRTGLFSRVDAEVERGEAGGARVNFALVERPRFQVGYGVLWDSEEGTAGVVDVVDRNFLGRGLTLGARGLYSSDDRSGRLYLRSGGLLGSRVSLESYALERRRLFPTANLAEDRRELALQVARPLGAGTTARLYARYRTTHLYEIDPNPFFPFDTELRLPYLGLQLVRDSRDDAGDPARGWLASFDLSGSGDLLGSDFEYLRLFAHVASFHPLAGGGGRWSWAQAVRLGLAHPFGGQEVIEDERFFAGGPYSVRGYELESLGPRESLGGTIRNLGGEAMIAFSQELRRALPWDLTALAFFDAGQVWGRPGEVGLDLAKALGLGLRARTPLGLVRLDAALPLDRRSGDARYQLYFGFGNAF